MWFLVWALKHPILIMLYAILMQLKAYSAPGHELLGSFDRPTLSFLAQLSLAVSDIRDKVGHTTV